MPVVDVVFTFLQIRYLQIVAAQLKGIADTHFLYIGLIEGGAGKPDKYEHDAHVYQISAIPPCIAMGQFQCAAEQVHVVLDCDGAAALVELHQHCERNEETEAEGDQRIKAAHTGGQQYTDQHQGGKSRPLEVTTQTFQ